MRAPQPLLSTLLLFAAISVAHASPGAAAGWSPPVLAPNTNSPAPAPPPPSTPPAPAAIVAATAPVAEAPAAKSTHRVRPRPKPCKKGKARCNPPPQPPKVDPRLIEARTQRARLLGMAQPLAAAGRPGDAARMLGGAAAAHADPILYLAAAEAELTGVKVSGERLTRALHLTKEAQRLIATPIDLRITVAEGPGLDAEAQALAAYVTRRQAQLRRQRRGKAELACGTAFLVLGATGLGMLASGAALTSRVDAARDAYTGKDAAYLAALTRSEQQAGNLLTAGMISGLFGVALGIPLTIMGARDLKRARSSGPERPSFRITPGLTGLSLRGKF